ncbi:threonine ammonia-lyase [Hoeflea sp.]|uniref:threonine ammonia-lyase n=1 Tax=Hoeflea sp. TaxID=1940281 RepID=UPI003B01FB23
MLKSAAGDASGAVSIGLIEDAAERLNGLAVRTPLLGSSQLNEILGMRLFFKPECLQRTGSFKFRGAYTKLSRIPSEERKRGVVAYSSGNHAQGVASAAQLLGMHATIVMPSDAPRIKIENTRGYGAQIVLYERHVEDRRAIAEEIAEKSGSLVVPPFNDRDIISGQGTVGLEIAQQAGDLDISFDEVLCPVGGGGLLSGLATALAARFPMARMWCAEPVGYDDVIRSLEAGTPVTAEVGAASICDAIVTPRPGNITFEIMQRLVSGGFAVSDDEVVRAIAVLFDRLKLVVEPGGAAAFAALLQQRERFAGKTVVIVLSGGNVDRDDYAGFLERAKSMDSSLPA